MGGGHSNVSMEFRTSFCGSLPLISLYNSIGWVSFFILVNYKLPFRSNKTTYYEYTGLWHSYAIFAMNTWFWSAVFHSRVVELTQKLDNSSALALLGYSLIIATIRAFNVRLEAARVMVAAPIIAFTSTHLLYLNFYQFDYGLNMIVCTAMGILKLILWAVWAGVIVCTAMEILKLILWAVWAGVTSNQHPSCWKLLVVVLEEPFP